MRPRIRLPRWAQRRRTRAALALFVVLVLVAVWLLSRCSPEPDTVRVVAVGDMACDPDDPNFTRTTKAQGDHCRHQAVSDIAVGLNPAVLLGLGDYQYELPATEAYRTVYGPSYGRLLSRTVPVYGNQEYKVQDANTFTAYFGDRIKDPRGYWSQDVGRWHLIVLNSNCAAVAGGCGEGSPQQTWLKQDLEANDRRCVLAAWHHPRWSTGIAGPDPRTDQLFQTLYKYRVELLLSGHEAHYERFEPFDPAGRPSATGVRQMVAGAGGQSHYKPDPQDAARDERGNPIVRKGDPVSQFADFDHHGVLELELAPDSYTWRYHPLEAGQPVTDHGTASCH